jgi:small subunit ribosomal protein S17
MAEKKETKKPTSRKPAATREKAAPAQSGQTATAQVDARSGLEKRRVVTGTVVSDKMQKTIVVKVDRRVRHRLYKKYVTMSRRFKAHDETNQAKIGDLVTLVESRPLSREKRWALQAIVRRAGQTPDANV